HDAPGGLERRLAFVAVSNRDSEAAAVAEVVANLRAAVRKIDDDLGHAARSEPRDVMLDQRPAADREQWLRLRRGERAHALAAPGCEDHRFHRQSDNARRQSSVITCNSPSKPLKQCSVYAIVTVSTQAALTLRSEPSFDLHVLARSVFGTARGGPG